MYNQYDKRNNPIILICFISEKVVFNCTHPSFTASEKIISSLFLGSGTNKKIGIEKTAHHTATVTKDKRIAVVESWIPNQCGF